MESHRRGDLTEQIVITELKRRCISVSTPIGDNERYDVVLEQPSGNLLRAQIKTGRLKDGVIRFKGVSQHTNSSGHVYQRYGDDVDCFLVYCYETEQTYFIDSAEVGTSMYLRVDSPRQDTNQINWAKEYRLDDQWPLENQEQELSAVSVAVDALRETDESIFTDPTGDDSRTVLFVDSHEKIRSVGIETGWLIDGRIRFVPRQSHDHYLVYCAELERLLAVNANDFDRSISFRPANTSRSFARSNSVEAYAFENNWPPEIDPVPPISSIEPLSRLADRLGEHGTEPSIVPGRNNRTLVVSHNESEYRVRVASTWIENGSLRFDADGDAVDYYALEHPEDDTFFLVPDEAFSNSISLRVEPPEIANPQINYADRFRLDRMWPP
ncbi:group I intron-associated PD-(D/E)XK endonuclease [Halopenitus salinus]|uniref:Group I intron-associated PD-(D/E)XK endonuclease n=1 Tax=Halopenitus salinus TaxID=1198295 RepID=A0ABD5UWN3_9EURY